MVCPGISGAYAATISGVVLDEKGNVIPGVYVELSHAGKSSITDEAGHFTFAELAPGVYELSFSYIGFEPQKRTLTINAVRHDVNMEVTLVEQVTELNEVTITGKTEGQELQESVASVAVLDTRDFYSKNINTSDVIKQISGVNVRQTGGFGSDAQVYINGMSGKQVKFFLDGIPLSYFGSGFGLNALPVNMMKRIEVYKGVVPVDLGADALGGGINIISRKEYISYMDASYARGSFNTHKLNFNGQWVNPSENVILGLSSFYNHSDNNYKIDVEIPDANGNPQPATARRFHDRFTNYLLNFHGGVFDKKYADRLMVSVRYSGLDDDIQHNAIMSQPYGEATYEESTTGVSLEYEKQSVLPRTDLKWYGGANFTSGYFQDTTLNAYTWDGRVYRRRTDGGEISTSGNLLDLSSKNAVNRLNITFHPWSKGHFTLNILSSWFKRVGEDPVASDFYGQDFYGNPTKLIRNVAGLAYKHAFINGLTSYTALKYFAFSADGYSIRNMEFLPHSQSISNYGISQSLKYSFTGHLRAKASYEYATRLPDEHELFGDFTLVRPNPSLNPEKSHNANAGLQLNSRRITAEVSTFYRITNNIIWLRTSQFFAQYQNLLKAMVKGVEAEIQYTPFTFLSVKANATYQDIRNRSPREVTGSVDNRYFDARLPNIPYLFGNGEVRFTKENILGSKNSFSAWWSAGYVHDFYLFWAVDGRKDLKNTIPEQFIQNAGVSYSLPENKLSVALESSNLFDRKAYDNFSVQRPGRAFYLTLRTFINTNQNNK
ncbi:Outer membrane cobalamin receptor protein [Fulvivirga imtechensis AK7]|uniref:Outer membrane cobalamin receptor protein n=2 Tax=Fulvivirga TaxID=396811 RepID=L8JPU6_9BACT|nr:Outer membrane cobalamin receptor protein [Fulvivirga imtechensis AK7]